MATMTNRFPHHIKLFNIAFCDCSSGMYLLENSRRALAVISPRPLALISCVWPAHCTIKINSPTPNQNRRRRSPSLEQMLSTPGWIPPVARGGEGRRLEQPERRSAAGAGRKRRSRGSPSVGAGGSEAEAERKGRWSPPAARGSVRCGAVRRVR
jgi:hypothetical protein